MTNRNSRAPRKARMWITSPVTLTLTAASSGTSGIQISSQPTIDFEALMGRNLANVTIGQTFVRGWYTWDDTAAATPAWVQYVFGCILAPSSIDAIDFTGLFNHTDDYYLHDSRHLLEAETTPDVLFPRNNPAGSGLEISSGGQRKVRRRGDSLFVVAGKSATTEQDVTLRLSVTTLFLLPA